MKTSSFTRVISICLLIAFPFFGCQKEQTTDPTSQDQEEFAAISAESDAEAETVFNDVLDNVIGVNTEVGVGGTGIFSSSAIDSFHCYSITVTHLNTGSIFPIRIVLDFGNGCTGRDGRTRKGKIITEYSNRLTVAGATAATVFDNYSVNDVKVEGTHFVINNSTITHPMLEVKASARLSRSNGNFSQWNSTRTITQVDGQITSSVSDDVFAVTGSASGAVKNGDKFYQWATVISEPLLKKFSCRWIIQGTITIKKGTTQIAVLVYGSGQCDNKASFTVLGHVREITLH